MDRPALKAGLLGGFVLIVIGLLARDAASSCIWLLVELAIYVATGALAAGWWVSEQRRGGSKAGAGALAGVIAGALSGVAVMLEAPFSFAASGGSQQILAQLPPASLQQLRASGLDPNMLFNPATLSTVMLAAAGLCCGLSLAVGLLLGALGGLLYPGAPSRNRRQDETAAGQFASLQLDLPLEPLPSLGRGSGPQNVRIDDALNVVVALEQRWRGGDPAHLARLLPYLKHYSPMVRSVAARAMAEFLSVIAERSEPAEPAMQASVDSAMLGLLQALACETDAAAQAAIVATLDQSDSLLDPERLAAAIALGADPSPAAVAAGLGAPPAGINRAALLAALSQSGQPAT